MSFIDIATLTMHRRHEMELRVNSFLEKCDQVMTNIQKLKNRARELPEQLNCEPSELKDRFLSSIKQLEEYTYLITDFNIAVGMFDDKDSTEYTPVQDATIPNPNILQPTKFNLMDVLSETAPSTSTACPNNCPAELPKRKKIPKSEQVLIAFSSSSNSDESVNRSKRDILGKREMETQCQMVEEMKKVEVKDAPPSPLPVENLELPAQTILEVEHAYPATIMGVDGPSFWIITEDFEHFNSLLNDMTNYYKDRTRQISLEEVNKLSNCAFYDKANDTYFRGLIVTHPRDITDTAEIYSVDTGTIQCVPVDCIRPLVPLFCEQPPYARCCHLAGIDLLDNTSKDIHLKQERFMAEHIAKPCTIEVDDNTSESLGVYVILSTGEVLNDMIVEQGLASSNRAQSVNNTQNKAVYGPPELVDTEFDIDGPEYEDPLEAVTGYHNRDEAEICHHYKGGPEKTCFKGSRCKKKHILKHPDGWTRDQVEVVAKCKSLPLPLPGSFHKVLVTYVCHFDRLYVQFINPDEQDEPIPSFGVVLPPKNLKALIRDMNSLAARQSYKPLTLAPAPGELVAALYAPDEMWYRARVQATSRHDQTVQVMYIDYGNVVWVKEDAICELPPMYAMLPAQAIRCVLAGVEAKTNESSQWAEAKAALSHMTLDKMLEAHVIARNYDEITVDLFDIQGYSVSQQLAAKNLITLSRFHVIDDSNTRTKVVVP